MDKYWVIPDKVIPREDLTLVEFLKKSGYRIGNFEMASREINDDDTVVGKIYECDDKLNVVWPILFDSIGVKKISNLIKLLEVNDVPYIEKPTRKEALEGYEEQVSETLDRLRE